MNDWTEQIYEAISIFDQKAERKCEKEKRFYNISAAASSDMTHIIWVPFKLDGEDALFTYAD